MVAFVVTFSPRNNADQNLAYWDALCLVVLAVARMVLKASESFARMV